MPSADFRTFDDILTGYIEQHRLSGIVAAVTSDDKLLHSKTCGYQDRESGTPMAWNSIFRIYSMTKPITSMAAMMLWEDGKFSLDDPVAKFLPSFENTRILNPDGSINPAQGPMTIRHVLCHTAGMTLPTVNDDHLAPLYLQHQLDGMRSVGSLDEVVDRLGALPVMFEPGTQWAYSMSTDVLGRLVEIWSGQLFPEFLQTRIFNPLGMKDTRFQVDRSNISRLTTNYSIENDTLGPVIDSGAESTYLLPPNFASGSGGLTSTADDYLVFLRMLLNGGTHSGVRILKTETLALMTRNHLSGDMEELGATNFNGLSWKGIGFGLGFNVVLDHAKAEIPGPDGEYGWTGAAGTMFFVNPKLKIAGLLLTQYMPSQSYPLRQQFRNAVYDGLR